MSVWIFLKVFGDSCMLFSVMAALPKVFVHDFAPLVPGVVCGFAAAVACLLTEQGRGSWRYVLLILPALCFGLADGVLEYLMLLPVVVYAELVIFRGMLSLEYYGFRESFRRSAVIWGLGFAVLCALSYLEGTADAGAKVLAWQKPLELGGCWLLSGVVLLRRLRLGDTGCDRVRLGYGLAGCGAAAVGILGAQWLLEFFAGPVRDGLMGLFSYVLGLPMRVYAWLISLIVTGEMKAPPTNPTAPASGESEGTQFGGLLSWIREAVELHLPAQETEQFPWPLAVVVLIGVTAAMIVMLRSFRKNTLYSFGESVAEESEIIARELPREDRRSNRGKIRKYYRDYLKMEQKRGLAVKKHHTSRDILDARTRQTDPAAAEELRELYITARYDESARISAEQVRRAKLALKQSRGAQ